MFFHSVAIRQPLVPHLSSGRPATAPCYFHRRFGEAPHLARGPRETTGPVARHACDAGPIHSRLLHVSSRIEVTRIFVGTVAEVTTVSASPRVWKVRRNTVSLQAMNCLASTTYDKRCLKLYFWVVSVFSVDLLHRRYRT